MNNKLYIAFLLIFSCFFVACEDDEAPEFEGYYRLNVGGPTHVMPETTETYTLGDIENQESYTWTIDGPAEIVGATTGATVTVQFNAIGDVELTVANNGRDSRTLNIEVTPPLDDDGEPFFEMTSSVNEPGIIRSGESDTVFLSFNQSLANAPTVAFVTEDDAFTSGSLDDVVRMDGMNYYVIYTAGEGDGTPMLRVSGIQANEAFGGAELEDQDIEIYQVDNVRPVADVTYSQQAARAGTEVTVTVTFNEPVTFEDADDENLYILFSGPGVTAQRDTLMPTDDPRVYTFDYTTTSESNGMLQVALENVADLAGNTVSAVNNANGMRIDNLAPAVAATAVDNGDAAAISITSTESGTAMYLILSEGQDAPADADAFMEMTGAASGSMKVTAGVPQNRSVALANGRYVVYYMAQDEAGNYSNIRSTNLVMN